MFHHLSPTFLPFFSFYQNPNPFLKIIHRWNIPSGISGTPTGEIGRASTYKMLRSVFSKGMEALLIEFLVAGERAGMREELWAEVVELLGRERFEKVATNWVCSHALAHERRWHEVVQVEKVLREIGIEPLMTAATESVFRRSVALDLRAAFVSRPSSMEPVIRFFNERIGTKERERK